MRWSARFAVLLSIASIWVAMRPATAAATPDVETDELLLQGKQALIEKRGEEARKLFVQGAEHAESEPLRWQMQLGLALALVLERKLEQAAHAYRTFLRASASHPAAAGDKWQRRRARAAEDLRKLEQSLLATRAKVDIQTEPAQATITIDGEPSRRTTPAIVYLAAGTHRVVLELHGYLSERMSLVVEAGQEPMIHRKLARRAERTEPAAVPGPLPAPKPGPSPAPGGDPTSAPSVQVPGALSVALGGALSLGAGLLHWSATRDAEEVRQLQHVPPTADVAARDAELRESIEDYQVAYVTLYLVGGAATVTGVALLVYGALADEPVAEEGTLGAWLGPQAAGLSWQGQF